VLLVLVSVVVGARLFAAADKTREWVTSRVDLPAGHVVVAADLTTTRARLNPATSGLYYPGSRLREVVGGTLARPVGAGELVSGSDFAGEPGSPTRLVPLIVKAGRVPTLAAGDHVDVFVFQPGAAVSTASGGTGGGTQGTTGQPVPAGAGAEVLVLHDVEFVTQSSLSSGDRSLTLRVPVDAAIRAVAASQSERVDVVKLERDGRGATGATGPTAAPGYGR
jgi:hypothetical protein